MGVSTEKRPEFTVRRSSRRIECAQVQRESLVETSLESNGPAEKRCLRRLRAVGGPWQHTKDSEHGGEPHSHVPIMPSHHRLSKKFHCESCLRSTPSNFSNSSLVFPRRLLVRAV